MGYCNGKGKTFYSHRDVQAHMISKSHCKLLYEEGEDLHEFSKFYDFSSTWKKRKRSTKKRQNRPTSSLSTDNKETIIKEEEEDNDSEADDDEDDWVTDDEDEDINMDKEDNESDSEIEEDSDDYDDYTAHITPSGELLLPNGRILGHRQYKRLYN